MIHHSNPACGRCGYRHDSGDDEECAEGVMADLETANAVVARLTRERDEAKEEARVLRNDVRCWELRNYACTICGKVIPGKWHSDVHSECAERAGWGY